MEDNLKKNGRQPKKNLKMEDDLNQKNGRRPQQKFKKWKTTSTKMEDDLN
jgi:hypothetical protein